LSEERAYWLAWSQVPGVGPILLKRIWQQVGSLAEAWTASPRALEGIEGVGGRVSGALTEMRSRLNPTEFLESHLQDNPTFWTPSDRDYPRLLLEIPSPPPVLYYRGQVDLLENRGIKPLIGIVGTRYPTAHGRRWTRKISASLARYDFGVVSGLAMGIDGEAHHACLEAKGRTLAVLGTGWDVVYPNNHRPLYDRIEQQGSILSEYRAGTKPNKGNFPARNRIIAGLCRAVLVMEAPEKSGALITARYANDFCRDVYSLPNSPDIEEARGCLRLIHHGAEMIVKEDELLEMLGAIPKLEEATEAQTPELNLSPEFAKVLSAIAPTPTSLDRIVEETGFSASEVLGILLQLELLGLIANLPGMHYQRS
jgi:DNA processing protein